MATFIYSHNPGSQGAKLLAEALNVRRIRHEGSRVRLGQRDTVINWGSAGALPDHVRGAGRVLNSPTTVRVAANKLAFFDRVGGTVRTVPHTVDPAAARAWGTKVVCRHTLNGHSGAGIEIVEPGVDIPAAPCYTKYIVKESEWRIHVVNGAVIDATRKIRDPDFRGEPNWAVRNHEGGFIYARNSGAPSEDTVRQAVAAVEAVGLDFGAVDVMVSRATRGHPEVLSYVLEINTAPGLVGQTVESYAGAFKNVI
jgi:glutathione synthase/RimK-type ligase-like ATP-grasp enzyme